MIATPLPIRFFLPLSRDDQAVIFMYDFMWGSGMSTVQKCTALDPKALRAGEAECLSQASQWEVWSLR